MTWGGLSTPATQAVQALLLIDDLCSPLVLAHCFYFFFIMLPSERILFEFDLTVLPNGFSIEV